METFSVNGHAVDVACARERSIAGADIVRVGIGRAGVLLCVYTVIVDRFGDATVQDGPGGPPSFAPMGNEPPHAVFTRLVEALNTHGTDVRRALARESGLVRERARCRDIEIARYTAAVAS